MRQIQRVIVLLAVLPMAELSSNEAKFCKCNALHVLCDDGNFNNTRKPMKTQLVSPHPSHRTTIVNNLNFLRNAVANGDTIFPQASNMQKLKYSERLEKAAEKQVLYCNPWAGFFKTEEWCNHKCYKCTDVDGLDVHFSKATFKSPGGTNRISTLYSLLQYPPKTFIFEVSENYKVPSPEKIPGEQYEVKYMALQAKFAEVGCSATIYFDEGYMTHTLICAFGPSTPEMLAQPLYKVGVPCCHCQPHAKCSDKKYTALCEFEEGKSFNFTEGIAENGFCEKPMGSGRAFRRGKQVKKILRLGNLQSEENEVLEEPERMKALNIINIIIHDSFILLPGKQRTSNE